MVRTHLWQFFDVNVMCMLVQCTLHPGDSDGSGKRWAFAASAYAVCWALSMFGVWLLWELYYEYWRRWRQCEYLTYRSKTMR